MAAARESRADLAQGFTLVEVLVALVITAAIFSLVAGIMRSYVPILTRDNHIYPWQAVAYKRLHGAMTSLLYYPAAKGKFLSSRKTFTDFFQGEREEASFITASPPDGEAVSLIRVHAADNTLWCAQTRLYAMESDYLYPEENDQTEEVRILDGVRSVRFAYYDGDREASTMEEAYPERIGMTLTMTDGSEAQWYFRVRSNYVHKTILAGAYQEEEFSDDDS